jgi:flagellin
MLSATTNTAALTAQRFLDVSSNQASSSIAKMSSGNRIVKASDDASSLAIGNKLRADISALQQAGRNASQGASLLQVANGAIDRIGDILTRLKTLSTQVVNGTLSTSERQFAQQEFSQLVTQVDQISAQTRWNNVSMLNGGDKAVANTNALLANVSAGASGAFAGATTNAYFNATTPANVFTGFTGQVEGSVTSVNVTQNGTANQFKIEMTIGTQNFVGYASYSQPSGGSITMVSTSNDQNTFQLKNNNGALGVSAANLLADLKQATVLNSSTAPAASFQSSAKQDSVAAALIDSTAASLATVITANGATPNGTYTITSAYDATTLESTIRLHNATTGEVLSAVVDDPAAATANKAIVFSNGVQLNFATAQINALAVTNLDGIRFGVTSGAATTMDFQVGALATDLLQISFVAMTSTTLGLSSLNVETLAGGQAASAVVSDAIAKVNNAQAQLGAIQSRMEYVQSNLSTIVENLSAAKGIFLDVDMSKEMTEFTKNQTLMQAGVAMLSQANQMPKELLQLIRQ